MKKVVLLFCGMILISSAAMGQTGDRSDPLTWKRYTVKGEEFSVTLPNLPSVTTTNFFYFRLQKGRKQREVLAAANGVTYFIQVFENRKPSQSLDEFIAEENEKLEIDPTTERNLTINEVRGKEYSSRKESTSHCTVLCYGEAFVPIFCDRRRRRRRETVLFFNRAGQNGWD